MAALTLENPLFTTYAVAASIMVLLQAVSMSWLTVGRMMQVRGGFRSPEDLRKTPLNPAPNPKQLLPDERVERFRRIQMNDLENLPFRDGPPATRSPDRVVVREARRVTAGRSPERLTN